MGQDEVLEWFVKQRVVGNHKYFTVSQVYDGLLQDNKPHDLRRVRQSIWCLVRFNYLELGMNDNVWDWQRTFRVKDKYYTDKKVSNKKNNTDATVSMSGYYNVSYEAKNNGKNRNKKLKERQ